ncbi:MAG TPA: hypothetical protein VFA11_11090, partial [Acidimicrobiales bacterium]|nr:hypothetical protein [Acidimicrobiales bacterium]
MQIDQLGGNKLVAAATADVGQTRERVRQRRLRGLLIILSIVLAWTWLRNGRAPSFHLSPAWTPLLPGLVLMTLLGLALVVPLLGAGRSPHVLFRPGEIETRFSDVVGSAVVVEEVVKSLNLFLA